MASARQRRGGEHPPSPTSADPPEPPPAVLRNWSGNITYSTTEVFTPSSVRELQEYVRDAPPNTKLKAQGTRHCFSDIADGTGRLVSLENLNEILSWNEGDGQSTVTVGAGVTYGELAPKLHRRGYALANLASLPHINVAGAVATATHGSGVDNGNLSTSVVGLEMVDGRGALRRFDAAHPDWGGAVVALGALGIVTSVTLKLRPAFDLRQRVYENMPQDQLLDNFTRIMSAGYSVSLFTLWAPGRSVIDSVWVKTRVDDDYADGSICTHGQSSEGNTDSDGDELFGAKAATENIHPIPGCSAEHCTDQMSVPGPWYDRLPHFRMGFTPSCGKELQSEYLVPMEYATEVFRAIDELAAVIHPRLLISEIRCVAADELWLSTAYGRPSVGFHFTWKQDERAGVILNDVLPRIEGALEPFQARPHWGKLFTSFTPERLLGVYPKMTEFRELMSRYDPDGMFGNDFLRRFVVG